MNRNLLIVALISFVNALSISVVIPVIYVYGKQYGLSDFEASLLITLFALAQFIATPIIGRLSDYYGRKPLLAISLFGTAVSNVLAAFAPSAAFLFVARVLDGITGGNNSVAQAVISDTTRPEERAKGFGIFGAAFGIAFIVGPIISIFAQQISLAAPYIASALFALIATLLTIFALPETLKQRETAKLSIKNLGFAQIGRSLLLPVVGPLMILSFLSATSFNIFTFGFQPFMIERLQFDSQAIALVLIVYGLISAIMQGALIGKLNKRYSSIGLLIFSLVASGLTLFGYAVVADQLQFWLLVVVFGIVSSFSRPLITTLLSRATKAEDQGVAIGVNEAYYSLSSIAGPLIGGSVISIGITLPLLSAGAVSILSFIVLVLVRDKFGTTKANY